MEGGLPGQVVAGTFEDQRRRGQADQAWPRIGRPGCGRRLRVLQPVEPGAVQRWPGVSGVGAVQGGAR